MLRSRTLQVEGIVTLQVEGIVGEGRFGVGWNATGGDGLVAASAPCFMMRVARLEMVSWYPL